MHDSSGNNDHPFLQFLNRLMAIYWFLMLFIVPMFAWKQLRKAYRKRRATKDKYERRFWTSEIRQCWCVLYLAVVMYYHIFVIDLLPVSFDTKDTITYWVDMVMGSPGILWYVFTNHQVLQRGNPTDFLFVTFMSVFCLWVYYLIRMYLKVHGDEDVDGDWEPPKKLAAKEIAKFDREETAFRAITKVVVAHKRNHPQSDRNAWNKMSSVQQSAAMDVWQAKMDELRRKQSATPRASCFDAK